MTSVHEELAQIVRLDVLSMEGVTRFSPNRRFAPVYSEGKPADSVYFLESGLVKIYKRGPRSKAVIFDIILPGQLFGVQSLGPSSEREASAEILQEGHLLVIPRELFLQFCASRPHMWHLLAEAFLLANVELHRKLELVCLRDIEYRILHFVAQLAEAIDGRPDDHERSVPLSQTELACLVNATRETTSTTLNRLERGGLVRLGRRQLFIPSLKSLRGVLSARAAHASQG